MAPPKKIENKAKVDLAPAVSDPIKIEDAESETPLSTGSKVYPFRGYEIKTIPVFGAGILIKSAKLGKRSIEIQAESEEYQEEHSHEITLGSHDLFLSMISSEHRAFVDNMIQNPKTDKDIISIEEYGEMNKKLMELLSGNPTQPSLDSASVSSKTSDSLTANLSQKVTEEESMILKADSF